MNEISFKSQIRTIPQKQFYEYVQRIGTKNSVNYPWTVKQSVFNTKAYTEAVQDCTAVGITDGMSVLLMHICPTRKENRKISLITNYIKNKINSMNKDYLQAIVLGSDDYRQSRNIFNGIIKFLEESKIPTSYFRKGKAKTHLAYWPTTDEWLISNANIKPNSQTKKNLKECFSEMKISELDEIV